MIIFDYLKVFESPEIGCQLCSYTELFMNIHEFFWEDDHYHKCSTNLCFFQEKTERQFGKTVQPASLQTVLNLVQYTNRYGVMEELIR